MARNYGRSDRVSSEMQKELSFIMQRDLDDSRLGFITINEVEVSKDLAMAKVYITILNADEKAKREQMKILKELAPLIRHKLAQRMRLRHISELRFYYDDSLDTGLRVAELLNEESKYISDEDA